MTTPPFNQTEALAHELAIEWELDRDESVHLEAAINNLYLDLGHPPVSRFVNAVRQFFVDVADNVLDDE